MGEASREGQGFTTALETSGRPHAGLRDVVDMLQVCSNCHVEEGSSGAQGQGPVRGCR